METQSLWKAITEIKSPYPSLNQDIETDVVIIGGGITGITAAAQLTQAGKKVVVLEQQTIGNGTTGFSTGNLYISVQPYYQEIHKKFGCDTVDTIIKSRKIAIDFIEKNISENNLHCHFARRPWFLLTNDTNKIPQLEKEAEIFDEHQCPVEEVYELDTPIPIKKAIKMNHQARFNPLEYVSQLAEKLSKAGCQIYEKTPIINYEENKSGCVIFTKHHRVSAKKLFLATHVPKGINTTQLFLSPYRSYVVAAKLAGNIYPNGNYWDLSDPHHAISTHSTGENLDLNILAIAGNHHKTGQGINTEKSFQLLESFMRKIWDVDTIEYRWSAQHYQSADTIPYIGFASRASHHTYIATGFFADGLVYGTVAGMLISDLILENKNEWAEIYNPQRIALRASATSFVKENTNVFAQYLKDFPGNVQAKRTEDIIEGEGKIIEIEGEKIAVYRDANKQLHAVSAVCTHMECIVAWNSAEKTWDCPCHGSRFTHTGEVIEGPAYAPLKRKELK